MDSYTEFYNDHYSYPCLPCRQSTRSSSRLNSEFTRAKTRAIVAQFSGLKNLHDSKYLIPWELWSYNISIPCRIFRINSRVNFLETLPRVGTSDSSFGPKAECQAEGLRQGSMQDSKSLLATACCVCRMCVSPKP